MDLFQDGRSIKMAVASVLRMDELMACLRLRFMIWSFRWDGSLRNQ